LNICTIRGIKKIFGIEQTNLNQMLKSIYLLIIITLLGTLNSKATTGCVANSAPTIIYLQKTGSNYRSNGTTETLDGGCNWKFNWPLSSCNVNSGVGSGYLAVDTPQDCPLDDHIYVIILALLISGVYFYKNGYFTNRRTRLALLRPNNNFLRN
jgi:hypothetical protein